MTGSKLKPHPLPDAALDADIAIPGQKGRGKTFAAKRIVERLLHMHRRLLALDPLSVWWGLKSGADGNAGRNQARKVHGSLAALPCG